MEINPEFKKVAIWAAREAGRILQKHFRKPIKISFKKDSSFVTDVDLQADKIITKILKKNFPSHNIVSEESGGKFGREFTWVMDPLDGTTNYIVGFPFFSVTLALIKKEEPILSVVFNPLSKELYLAEKGQGAYLNQRKIKVNKINNLSRIFLIFNKGKDLNGGLRVLTKIAPRIGMVRFWGSAHLEICQVATGKVEGYLTSKPDYLDSIAGAFIAEEAGGRATDFNGKRYTRDSQNLLITNKEIHNSLLKIINKK